MADNMKNTYKTVAHSARRGLRARLGVGLLSIGLASGAGVLAIGAQPASAATWSGGSTIVVDSPVRSPLPGGFQTLGVSWS
jgi:hypothetical protein